MLVEYSRTCQGIHIRLLAKQKSDLFIDLKAGSVDLAVASGRATGDGIQSMSLWSERVLLIVPEFHTLAACGYANWGDLDDEVVLISRRGPGPELKELLMVKLGMLGLRPMIEEHSIGGEALLSLVAAGHGVTLQCEGIVRNPPAGLASLEVQDPTGASWISFSACWKKTNDNPALASFLALLRAHRSMVAPGWVPDT